MQTSQVKEQFSRIERSIDQAAQLCESANQVPEKLRSCIAKLDSESDQAKQMLSQETSDSEIIDCIDRLEELGDQAMEACKQGGNSVDPDLQHAVKQAHDELSSLKHQLH